MEYQGDKGYLDLKEIKSSPQYGASLRWSAEQKKKSADRAAKAIAKNINEHAVESESDEKSNKDKQKEKRSQKNK